MLDLVTKIVCDYQKANPVAARDLPDLIALTYTALTTVETAREESPALTPAVPLKKSVKSDAIICLECGKPQKMLKRHLNTAHGLSVDDYRGKWGLSSDYPMVAPDYAARRSQLAKDAGLGTKPRTQAAEATPAPVETTAPAVTAPAPEVAAAAADPIDDTARTGLTKAPSHRYPASRWSKVSE